MEKVEKTEKRKEKKEKKDSDEGESSISFEKWAQKQQQIRQNFNKFERCFNRERVERKVILIEL